MGYMGISVSYMLWILDTNTKELHENICQLHQLHVLDTSTIKLHENICQLHFLDLHENICQHTAFNKLVT